MKRLLVLVAGTLGVFALGYVLEWHVVLPVQELIAQQGLTAYDGMTAVWRPVIAWLLEAAAVGGVAWLLYRWADRDRASALAVAALGAVAWLLPVLYMWEPTGRFLPNWLDQFAGGDSGFIRIAGAFLLILSLSALVPRRPEARP